MDTNTYDAFEGALRDRMRNIRNILAGDSPWFSISQTTRDTMSEDLASTQNALDYLHNNYTRED